MPQIYSGRKKDQLYNAIGNRLVRRSNALEDDYTGDVHPELRRIVNEMYLRTPDAFSALKWMSLPDGYAVSGPNRINRVREIVPGSGDATQGTASDQPEISRTDDRMNLATHSRLPGTLGASSPDGWTASAAGEIVASDDSSDGHQGYKFPATMTLQQDRGMLLGQRLIIASRIEAANSSTSDAVGLVDISHTLNEGYRDVGSATSGEWLWADVTIDETATGKIQLKGAGNDRQSRPMILYRPDNWASLSASEKQQYLTDHYAASGPDHAEFPGYRGMRTVHVDGTNHRLEASMTPTLPTDGEGTFAILANPRNADGEVWTSSSGFRIGMRIVSGVFRLDVRDAADLVFPYRVQTSNWSRNEWQTFVGTTKIGEPNRLYRNGSLAGTASENQPSYISPTPLDLRGHFGLSFGLAAFLYFNRRLSAEEVAALNSILRGES